MFTTVRFSLSPSAEQLHAIWQVLSKQYRLPLSPHTMRGLVKEFPRLSGRNIKNLLKLARMLLARKKDSEPDVKLFQYIANFLDLQPDQKASP